MAKKQSIDWKGQSIEIVYGHGETWAGDCSKLPKSIFEDCAAARHGIAQKLGDAKSGGTSKEKIAEVREIWAGMLTGSWNRKAQSTLVEIVERAYAIIAEGLGKPKAQADAWFQQYLDADEEKQAEIRAKPHMKAALQQARTERSLADVEESDGDFDPNA
jgi:hypothetical protein